KDASPMSCWTSLLSRFLRGAAHIRSRLERGGRPPLLAVAAAAGAASAALVKAAAANGAATWAWLAAAALAFALAFPATLPLADIASAAALAGPEDLASIR